MLISRDKEDLPMKMKKVLALGMTAATVFSVLALTGCGGDSAGGDTDFSWWITSTDGNGTYYDAYEDNPAVQWLNQQYWDVENGGLGTEESGTPVRFSFQTPITGSEADNFNTMMSTGEYTDIIDLAYCSDTTPTLINEGVLMDLTDYVKEYMPNYLAYLEKNPEQEALLTHTDEDGNTRYYEIGTIKEENDVPWGGFMYRRDWVVDYAEPTSHVWDWDSAYVKEHGHPAVTPLDEAVGSGNMEGWKVNEVTEFTSSEGENPNEDYSDNVIFPSGTADPLTISDWEWMLEAFQRAIEDKGFSGNADSYGISMYYPGYIATGDLASSFGAGTGMWSKDADQKVYFGGNGDGFRTYLECLNAWNNNGWLDSRFETRASDIFFQINQTGTAQGQVGMWYGLVGRLGTTIRATCADPTDQQRAYVMGCAVPINDVYGTEEQKFITPDAFYQGSRIAGKIAITTAAEDKDLGALLTCLDWFYTPEGAATRSFGLSQEQLDSCEIENNLYEENNIPGAYTLGTDENGNPLYTLNYEDGSDLCNALKPMRLVVGMEYSGAGADIDYTLDRGDAAVTADAKTQWTKYISTASVSDYNAQFTDEQNELYTSLDQTVNDYMAQNVPVMIKEGLDSWDAYVEGLNGLGIDEMTAVYQEIVDELFQK